MTDESRRIVGSKRDYDVRTHARTPTYYTYLGTPSVKEIERLTNEGEMSQAFRLVFVRLPSFSQCVIDAIPVL